MMVARPAPRVVDVTPWRAAWTAAGDRLRLLVGGGASRSSSRWHAWMALGWVILAFSTLAGLEAVRPVPDAHSTTMGIVPSSAPEAADGAAVAEATAGVDLTSLARSSLFRPPVVRTRPKPSAIVPDLGNELQLHGVIGGESPQAIIFHKRTQQTHSVRVGQTFGEFEVMEIQSMKVILKWRDETIELSM